MTPFLLGKKVGMTQVFAADGTVIPVTVLHAGPCVVSAVKTVQKDGYSAVQIAYGQSKNVNKPQVGHLKAAGVSTNMLREVRLEDDADLPKIGLKLDVTQFEQIPMVTIAGTSKGKGFAGVIKRHHFHRGPTTHGSDHHRAPGSIGSMFPQRVLKGKKMPGHLGHDRVTIKGVDVVSINKSNDTLVVKGSVPGPIGSVLEIRG